MAAYSLAAAGITLANQAVYTPLFLNPPAAPSLGSSASCGFGSASPIIWRRLNGRVQIDTQNYGLFPLCSLSASPAKLQRVHIGGFGRFWKP